MALGVRQPERALEGPTVEGGRVEIVEMHLRSPEHVELAIPPQGGESLAPSPMDIGTGEPLATSPMDTGTGEPLATSPMDTGTGEPLATSPMDTGTAETALTGVRAGSPGRRAAGHTGQVSADDASRHAHGSTGEAATSGCRWGR